MIPEKIKDREEYMLFQIKAGNFQVNWALIDTNISGHNIKMYVMDDALKIDGVRINVSAALSQKIADVLDSSLPTAYVADMMFAFAARVATPCPVKISSSTKSMIEHSDAVDRKIALPNGGVGLAATVGKHWILDKRLEWKKNSACNYGWHFVGRAFQGIRGFEPASGTRFCQDGTRIIQPAATAHDEEHVDYSQICQLVSQRMIIDGLDIRFADAIKHPEYSKLIVGNEPLAIDRQPNS